MDSDLKRASELLGRGELKNGLRALERARRRALAARDVVQLRRLRDLALEAAAGPGSSAKAQDLVYATEQNVRFLTRTAAFSAGQDWVDPFPMATPSSTAVEQAPSIRPAGQSTATASFAQTPAPQDRRVGSQGLPPTEPPAPAPAAIKPATRTLFGDAQRLRSLVLGLVASFAGFWPIWGAMLIIGAMAGGPINRGWLEVVVGFAVFFDVVGMTIVVGTWIAARRRSRREERTPLLSPAGAGAGAVVLTAAAANAVGAYFVWAFLWTRI